MAQTATKPSANFAKYMRGVTYLVYAFAVTATLFLFTGFLLLLLGANPATPFVQFVYKVAYEFLQPFRGIFPTHQVTETGYFSSAALFAMIMYLIFAAGLHTLIDFLTAKMNKYQSKV